MPLGSARLTMSTDTLNAWAQLEYLDPEPVLRNLRRLEIKLLAQPIPPRVLRLRTSALKPDREGRDAALFAHGIAAAMGTKVYFARQEAADYDFVTRWLVGDELRYCAVQLKELPPEDLNPLLTLESLLSGLGKYGTTRTALAVLLNKAGVMDAASLPQQARRFSQVWLFWLASPDGNRWKIQGDILATPFTYDFHYPQGAA